jgi:all-trans-retinol 13,14-reductase
MPDVDTVVIGSGAGGLTAALALARAGELVVVFEQHYLPGGYCHSFALGGYSWSPGVHYIGQLQPGGEVRRFYEGLGVSADLVFCELNPDGFDRVIVGDRGYHHVAGLARNVEQLASAFPADAAGIRGYHDELTRIAAAFQGGDPGARDPALTLAAGSSLDALLRRHVRDPVARTVLAAQGLNYGVAPSRVAALVHAGLALHYADGGWYPLGGGRALPRAFIRALRAAGGEIQVRTRVERILVEGEPGRARAVGVRLAGGETITAGRVISNADAGVTYGRLVGPALVGPALRRRLERAEWAASSLSLFAVVELDAAALGFDSGNTWLFADADAERAYTLGEAELWGSAPLQGMFVSFPTLKDPSSRRGGLHAIEAFVLVDYQAFARWAGSDHARRPEAYERLKAHLMERMLDALARLVPGVRERLRFCALGTPLTNEFYVEATRGSLYGTARSLAQGGGYGFPIESEIEGLLLCGASTLSHGVYGSALSGLHAAGLALGVSPQELLGAGGPPLRTVPADRPEAWPVDLRQRAGAPVHAED